MGQGNQADRKEYKNRHKNQRPTCSHTQESHKNTKLKATLYYSGF